MNRGVNILSRTTMCSIDSRLSTPIRREGITVLSDPPECQFDIVVIHGLNGSPRDTFLDKATGFYWPTDLASTFPNARIMVFGYMAGITSSTSNNLGVYQHAESLLVHLKNDRVGSAISQRPVVFIGHSLGGVVIKQALVLDSQSGPRATILSSTKLVVFLGTPHRGSHVLDKTSTKVATTLASFARMELPKNVKPMLQTRSNDSFAINLDFMRVKGNIAVVNFYEQVDRPLLQDLVVDKDSAVFDSENSENIPMSRDHEHLVRFDGPDNDSYHLLCATLRRKLAGIFDGITKRKEDEHMQQMIHACLRSLGHTNISSGSQRKEAHHRTLSWAWHAGEGGLHSWFRSGSGYFAITGKPGSGKSVLMSEVMRRAHKEYRSLFGAVLTHTFKARGTREESSLDGMLRSVIHQLLCQVPSAFTAMVDEWHYVRSNGAATSLSPEVASQGNAGSVRWSTQSLKKSLWALILHISKGSRVCLLIDAINECGDGQKEFDELINFLRTLLDESNKGVRGGISLCCSSRGVSMALIPFVVQSYRMEERNGPDIEAYVNDQWHTPKAAPGTEDPIALLKRHLIQKADGIFLWAHLSMERIRTAIDDGDTITELQQAVDEIPDELNGLFTLLLDEVKDKDLDEANTMMSIVLAASRPLTLSEFRHVMALSKSAPATSSHQDLYAAPWMVKDDTTMRRRVRSRSGGLLESKLVVATDLNGTGTTSPALAPTKGGDTYIVQFIHESVRDYLQQRTARKISVSAADGHTILAQTSLQYILFNEVQDLGYQLRTHHGSLNASLQRRSGTLLWKENMPFIDYASQYCFHHCQEARQAEQAIAEAIDRHFGGNNEPFANYIALHNAASDGDKHSQALTLTQLAVERNLAKYVHLQLSSRSLEVNVMLEGQQTYLQIAVWKGHAEMLKVLLSAGADINCYVMQYGRPKAVMDHTYEDLIPFGLGVPYKFLPPLVVACRSGNVEIVRLLVDHGTELFSGLYSLIMPRSICGGSRDVYSNSALVAAVFSGSLEVVQRLLESDPRTFSHPELRMSAILALRKQLLKMLEDKYQIAGSEVSAAPDDQSLGDKIEMMQHIAQYILQGTDISRIDFNAFSPGFLWLVTGCDYGTMQRLTAPGIALPAADATGMSFFHSACVLGTESTARLLHQHGENPYRPYGTDNLSCLQLAVRNSSPGVLLYLLEEVGMAVDTPDAWGTTALIDAARFASDDFIHIILDHGASIAATNAYGATPLQVAMQNFSIKNHTAVYERLFSQQSDLEKGLHGFPPVHLAAGCGNLSGILWLLEQGASISQLSADGSTVLHAAAACGNTRSTGVLSFLLERLSKEHREDGSLNVNTRDGGNSTPLHRLFRPEESLQEQQEDETKKQSEKFNQAVAAENALLLLRYGADLSALDQVGNTPLHLAAWRNAKEVVQMLLKEGADPFAQDLNGLRPLDLARVEDVRDLLERAMERK
ncbi:ankyrin repeat-containing domain protein [Cladorrhinum sp. PSN332]|nr:ankyrin repeat-containing domain protein [Cladorrhinum sp. PSN332]